MFHTGSWAAPQSPGAFASAMALKVADMPVLTGIQSFPARMRKETFAGAEGSIMGILSVAGVLLVALLAAGWSCSRSYFGLGCRRGVARATDELLRGLQPHLGTRDAAVPASVIKALDKSKKIAADPNCRFEPALWDVGNAAGEACWRNGYLEGVKVGAIPTDMIRLDLTLAELQQMSWLAHLGFLHMMPNYRGFEVHRFSGPDEAFQGARSVGILECALPKAERPFADIKTQIMGREKMVSDWWPAPATREVA